MVRSFHYAALTAAVDDAVRREVPGGAGALGAFWHTGSRDLSHGLSRDGGGRSVSAKDPVEFCGAARLLSDQARRNELRYELLMLAGDAAFR